MKKLIFRLLAFALVVMVMTSCRSSKQTEKTDISNISIGTMPSSVAAKGSVVEKVLANRSDSKTVTAKLGLQLVAGSRDVSIGGSLRMKRDDVIQLSLVFLGLFDVGCMEFTPDYILVMDRMNHQYIKVNYKEVDFFRESGLNFQVFQSLFWDELFLLGEQGNKIKDSHFQVTRAEQQVTLTNTDSRWVALNFLLNALENRVSQTSILPKQNQSSTASLTWKYLSYGKLGEQEFPSRMQVDINTGKKPVQATISLSNLRTDANWETRTKIDTNKYTAVSLETVFNRIMKLAQ